MDDPFDLERFVRAQDPVYRAVTAELRAGAKGSHWMWFVFPQHRSLGRSPTALRFGLGGRAEAAAYWRHSVLGPRLRHCCELLLTHPDLSANEILGSPDDLKLRSSMSLFAQAVPDEAIFGRVLQRFYDGEPDPRCAALP